MPRFISEETREKVCEFYKSKPMSFDEVVNEFGICRPKVSEILKQNNIPIYTKNQLYNPNLKEDYFETIDTEEKAYFLGLLLTDGNVHIPPSGSCQRQASISLCLDEKDQYMIERFKEVIKTDTEIIKDNRPQKSNTCTVAFRSDKMAEDLAKYGVVPRKSTNSYLPKIDPELEHHMIRGILDGDGSVQARIDKTTGKFIHSVGFSGTERLMTDIRDNMVEKLDVNENSVYNYKDKQLSMITWGAKDDIQSIYHNLYDDSNIHLSRKKEKFEEILEHYDLD